MYKFINGCRACGYGKNDGPGGIKSVATNDRLIPVLNLGVMPLANDFVKNGSEHKGFTPISLNFCPRCTLAQLSIVVDPEILYKNYVYVTSGSETMQSHFASLVSDLLAEQKSGSVVEIGSNNGALLTYMSKVGFGTVVGIEPAGNLAQQAIKSGVPTVNEFFNKHAAQRAGSICGKPDFILARHCFAHIDNWADFVTALEVLTHSETLIGIEVPYLPDMMTNVSFDQCYGEHLSYITIRAIKVLLESTRLHLHRVNKYPIHGGSILILLRHNNTSKPTHPSVEEFMAKENITVDAWREFAAESYAQIHKLGSFVRQLRADGKTVCGYGASAKSTVWNAACKFTRKEINFITDDTPGKQYCTSPGTDIPITDPGALLRELPDYCILWAWNFRDEILEKEKLYREKGGKFLLPVPQIKVI